MYSKTCLIPVKNVRDKLIETTPLSSLLSNCIVVLESKVKVNPLSISGRSLQDK
jgi:hypothetical protein